MPRDETSAGPRAGRHRRRATGLRGEVLAEQLAQSLGWQPFLCNVPIGGGEADVVCRQTRGEHTYGLLLEVKSTRDPAVDPAQRLGPRQRRRLWQMAQALADQYGWRQVEVAIVAVTLSDHRETARMMPLEPEPEDWDEPARST